MGRIGKLSLFWLLIICPGMAMSGSLYFCGFIFSNKFIEPNFKSIVALQNVAQSGSPGLKTQSSLQYSLEQSPMSENFISQNGSLKGYLIEAQGLFLKQLEFEQELTLLHIIRAFEFLREDPIEIYIYQRRLRTDPNNRFLFIAKIPIFNHRHSETKGRRRFQRRREKNASFAYVKVIFDLTPNNEIVLVSANKTRKGRYQWFLEIQKNQKM